MRSDDAASGGYHILVEAQGGIGLHWIGVELLVHLSPARWSFPLTKRQKAVYFVDNSTEQCQYLLRPSTKKTCRRASTDKGLGNPPQHYELWREVKISIPVLLNPRKCMTYTSHHGS
jgi:hypothetical protein